MMGPQHFLLGGLAGVSVATAQGRGLSMIVLTGIVATAASYGPLSPDVDQTEPWRRLARLVPNPLGKMLSHRFLSHWWALPVLAFHFLPSLPVEAQWAASALLIGWTSHLLGDFLFGGLYLLPWGGPKVGLPLDTDGVIENVVARTAMILALVYLLYLPLAAAHDLPRMS